MILNDAAIYHVYYNHLYWTKTPPAALMIIESVQNCEDIAFNILVARITKKPPIKLTSKKRTKEPSSRLVICFDMKLIGELLMSYFLIHLILCVNHSSSFSSMDQDKLKQRHNCMNELAEIYGSMPLKRSNIRMDPILFRDPVSNLRKKYRQLEILS